MFRRDPYGFATGAVMRVGARVHREQFVAHAKRRLTPRLGLVRFGQRETDFAKAIENALSGFHFRVFRWRPSRPTVRTVDSVGLPTPRPECPSRSPESTAPSASLTLPCSRTCRRH